MSINLEDFKTHPRVENYMQMKSSMNTDISVSLMPIGIRLPMATKRIRLQQCNLGSLHDIQDRYIRI